MPPRVRKYPVPESSIKKAPKLAEQTPGLVLKYEEADGQLRLAIPWQKETMKESTKENAGKAT